MSDTMDNRVWHALGLQSSKPFQIIILCSKFPRHLVFRYRKREFTSRFWKSALCRPLKTRLQGKCLSSLTDRCLANFCKLMDPKGGLPPVAAAQRFDNDEWSRLADLRLTRNHCL